MLTHENYHTLEMNQKYMGASQYKMFEGSLGMKGCYSRAMAVLRGDWEIENTNAMLVGSYVDAHFCGTLDVFKARHPEIFTKKGELLAGFKKAEELIQRIERDEYFMNTLSGKKQVIMTGELFGTGWKIAIDSLVEDRCIVDLKTCATIRKASWIKDFGHVDFVRFWGYEIQMAIYQKIVEINIGKKLPCLISAISKESEPDIEVIGFDQGILDDSLSLIEMNMPKILAVKRGEVEPDKCGHCDWCKHTRKLTKPVHLSELTLDFT